MTLIIRRDEIVKKQAKEFNREVDKAIECINNLLNSSTELPITCLLNVFGFTTIVRNEILRRMKESGWRVEFRADANEGKEWFTIQ